MNEQLTRRSADHIMHERMTAVETTQKHIQKDIATLHSKIDRRDLVEDEAHSKLEQKLNSIERKQDRQAGYFAGIATAISVIVAGIGMALKWFQQ